MIVMMTPEEVSKQWGVVRHAIEGSMPSNRSVTEAGMNNILMSILDGRMQCWAMEKEGKVQAIATTVYFFDPCGDKTLCVYSLYGYEIISDRMWKEALEKLGEFAKRNGCRYVVAYTVDKRVIDIADKNGATAEIFLTFDVGGIDDV